MKNTHLNTVCWSTEINSEEASTAIQGSFTLWHDGTVDETEVVTVSETQLFLQINDCMPVNLICLNDHIQELILGHMLTQGYIHGREDVEELRCHRALAGDLHYQVLFRPHIPQVTIHRVLWKPEWIFALARRFATDTPLYRRTHCVHSCLLAREDVILYQCEDIGRHNALDKAVGCALRDGVNRSECILYLSGRVPKDMMVKAINSGVGIVVSNSTATVQAVELARENAITLICSARPDHFDVMYNAILNG